jgi:hypothetical protein
VSGIREQRRGIRGEAVAGLDENERRIQPDPDDEGAAKVIGVSMAAMTVRTMIVSAMSVPMVRMIVIGMVMMMAAQHMPSLASAASSGDGGRRCHRSDILCGDIL